MYIYICRCVRKRGELRVVGDRSIPYTITLLVTRWWTVRDRIPPPTRPNPSPFHSAWLAHSKWPPCTSKLHIFFFSVRVFFLFFFFAPHEAKEEEVSNPIKSSPVAQKKEKGGREGNLILSKLRQCFVPVCFVLAFFPTTWGPIWLEQAVIQLASAPPTLTYLSQISTTILLLLLLLLLHSNSDPSEFFTGLHPSTIYSLSRWALVYEQHFHHHHHQQKKKKKQQEKLLV